MGSMESLIDSLRPATPSPSKGKSKAPEVQAAASTSDVQSLLPDYLVPHPQKKETVDAASKRADTNLSLIDAKINGVQAQLLEEFKSVRTHLTQLAADAADPPSKATTQLDHSTHTTISRLIMSHNTVVESVRDLSGHIASLTASTTSVNSRLNSLEASLGTVDSIRMPAEKRTRYEDVPISTLVHVPSPMQSELPHVGNPSLAYPSAATMTSYPSGPTPNTQAIPNPPTPSQFVRNSNTSNRRAVRTVQLGPMNWVNYEDEVQALINMIPALRTINKKTIQVNPSTFAHHVRITFGSPADATAFSRIWNASRPHQYSSVSVSFASEN
jgi:hypothetical protein